MFFQTKTKGAIARSERRRQYRIPQSKKNPLTVALKVGQEVIPGELLDLSAHGVGLNVNREKGKALNLGDAIEVGITRLSHGKVITPAKVVYMASGSEKMQRIGVEFINIGNLYSQLDGLFARVFNRRASNRVRPSLDRKLYVHLSWGGTSHKGTVVNISETGLGLTMPAADAGSLVGVKDVSISMRLPGESTDLQGRAIVRSVSVVGDRVIVGLMFDFDSPLEQHKPAIVNYIERRVIEIEKWESSWADKAQEKS